MEPTAYTLIMEMFADRSLLWRERRKTRKKNPGIAAGTESGLLLGKQERHSFEVNLIIVDDSIFGCEVDHFFQKILYFPKSGIGRSIDDLISTWHSPLIP